MFTDDEKSGEDKSEDGNVDRTLPPKKRGRVMLFSPGNSPRHTVTPKPRRPVVEKARSTVRGALRTLRTGRSGGCKRKTSPIQKLVDHAVRQALGKQMSFLSIKSPERQTEDDSVKTLETENSTTDPPTHPAAPTRMSSRARRPTAKAEQEKEAGTRKKRGRPPKKV